MKQTCSKCGHQVRYTSNTWHCNFCGTTVPQIDYMDQNGRKGTLTVGIISREVKKGGKSMAPKKKSTKDPKKDGKKKK